MPDGIIFIFVGYNLNLKTTTSPLYAKNTNG
jgi:hypothetical protein